MMNTNIKKAAPGGGNSEEYLSDKAVTAEAVPISFSDEAVSFPDYMKFKSLTDQVTEKMDFELNLGMSFPGVLVSPYYSLSVCGVPIPVYCTPVFTEETFGGVMHSFAAAEIKCSGEYNAEIRFGPDGITFDEAEIISLDGSTKVFPDTNGEISFTASKNGFYTFIFNSTQKYACSLRLTSYTDEEIELAELAKKAEKVIVYEKGLHYIDPVSIIGDNNTLIYLKKGAVLTAHHTGKFRNDYIGYRRENEPCEDDGINGMGIGLPRKAVFGVNGVCGLTIAGHGLMDFSMLDLGERSGIVITGSKDVVIKDITLINSCGWTVTLYNDDNVLISGVTAFSWRVGSDSFDICNCRNTLIDECYSRSGDDCYVIKAFPGSPGSICSDAVIKRSTAWAGKARCFCIASEVYKTVKNITFKNNVVIAHDATWDNDYVAALAVLIDTVAPDEEKTLVDGIVFENISIYHETGRPVLVNVYKPGLSGISVNAEFSDIFLFNEEKTQKCKISQKNESNRVKAKLKNIIIGGNQLSEANRENFIDSDSGTEISF